MQSWFYIKDNQQHGPVTKNDLIQMLADGTISLDTMVWSQGMAEWTTARDIKDLIPADILPPPIISPPPITPSFNEEAYIPSGPQIRPWVRYWARMMDVLIFALLFGFVLGIVYEPALRINDLLFDIIIGFIYIFVEPIMLSSWGTTPGKSLFRVRLRQEGGKLLDYSQGLNRAFKVLLYGEGFGIPIVALFTQISAYNRLTKEGKTSWDREGNFTVHHQVIGSLRIIISILIFIVIMTFIVIGKTET